jgi:SAM-dependent methyltransferase
VLEAAGVTGLDALDRSDAELLATGIRSFLRHAGDVVADPARQPGWRYDDPLVLEGQGRASTIIPRLLAKSSPALADVSSFLDVGVGVGWIAIGAAQTWPRCRVVGIDVWEPALRLARSNVARAGLEARVALRRQDVVDLDDVDGYDCVWLPSFFLSRATMSAAMAPVLRATRPDGVVVVACYEALADPLHHATMALRIVRDGGCLLDAAAAADLLRDAGCADVHGLERDWPSPFGFVVGHKRALGGPREVLL